MSESIAPPINELPPHREEFSITEEQFKRLERAFTYHKPKGTQPERYERLRNEAKALAHSIQASCPESREKSLAITHLENAIMWANAAIARNE